jgi:hypothetical protein
VWHNTVYAQTVDYTILGNVAFKFVREHRAIIEAARERTAADPILFGPCRVYEPDATLRAAVSTEECAKQYMTADRIMVLL